MTRPTRTDEWLLAHGYDTDYWLSERNGPYQPVTAEEFHAALSDTHPADDHTGHHLKEDPDNPPF